MADVRTDDFIAEIEIRSDDMQHGKSIELFAHTFRINDDTGEVDFVDKATRDHLMEQIEAAMLLVAEHQLAPLSRP
jgi:hypothetical protein